MSGNRALAIMTMCCVAMCAAYLLYLAASWNSYQQDRLKRDATVNDLLDRIKVKDKGPVIVVAPEQ